LRAGAFIFHQITDELKSKHFTRLAYNVDAMKSSGFKGTNLSKRDKVN